MHLDKGMDSWSRNYCKTVYHSEANEEGVHVLSDTSGLNRPVCAVPLAQAALDAHKLCYCTQCRGILIAVPVFESLLDQVCAKQAGAWTIARRRPGGTAAANPVPAMRPPDGYALLRRSGQLGIDDYAACKLNWMDKGKLTRIVRASRTRIA